MKHNVMYVCMVQLMSKFNKRTCVILYVSFEFKKGVGIDHYDKK